MIFCKGNIRPVLTHFSKMTRFETNLDKSNLFVAGVDTGLKEKLLGITGFSLGTLPVDVIKEKKRKKSFNAHWGFKCK